LKNRNKPQALSPAKPREAIERGRLLSRVATWYHRIFQEEERGRVALGKMGVGDAAMLSEFQVGWVNGSLMNTIPAGSDLEESLKALGVLTGEGKELFYGCVVFPWFDENAECVGMAGARVEGGEAVYLPGEKRGVWNWQAAKRSRVLILTSSILDALILYQAGFKEVIPVMDGLTDDHMRLFARFSTKEVYLCFEAGAGVYDRLKEEEITFYPVRLPQADVVGFFQATPEPVKAFEVLLTLANPKTALCSEETRRRKEGGWEKTDTGFSVEYGSRRYEVKGIAKEGVKLRVTVKAHTKGNEKRFHLDSVDLYSHRSRVLFAKGACGYFGEKEEVIREDLGKLIELAEGFEPPGKAKAKAPAMSKEEEGEALEMLKDPDLLTRILEDFETCGYTGEEANKLMGYLAAVSRKLDDPLSVLVQSRSAAGKSMLQDAVLRFVPREDFEKYTRLTGQALFYKDETALCHKLLAIEEEAGAREASYSIRNLQSSKALSIATTGKDPVTGKLKTAEYQVKGPVALMLTTTSVDMDYETANRFITLTIDESKEMTVRILERQRELETLAGLSKRRSQDQVAQKHQNAQRLLRALAVVNPYALKLSFPAESLRARRDHRKYLGLIKAIAFLHQYQREIKTHQEGDETLAYIEVELSDIEKANRLAGEVLGRTLDELSAPSRALLGVVRDMVKAKAKERGLEPNEYRFTRKDIRDFSGWSDFQVKTHIGELEDLEYLYSVTGHKGKEYVYELTAPEGGEDGKPFLAGLTKVEALNPI
jgi:DNA primase